MADDKKPKKPLTTAKGINELVEQMEANNKSTKNIEKDQRNTRRHLLEMKKMQTVIADFQARTVYGFENFQDMIDSNSLQGQEDAREKSSIFQEIRDELRNLPKDTAQASSEESRKGRGGGLGKIGGILAGAGIAAAGIGIGIAAVFYTAPKLIEAFEDMDVKKIAQNVETLVGINQSVKEKGGNLLKDGGSLALAMTGIGVGLLALGIGSGVNAGVDKFLDDGWAEKVRDNVSTLLSINSLAGGSLDFIGKGGGFALAMTGLGIGLAAFGIGKIADGTGDAINKFASGDNFAERIKNEVETLLSIDMSKADGKKLQFIATMSSLGLGLAAFAIGKAGSGVADAVNTFQSENFAKDIKSEVETLLEIPNLPGVGVDTLAFLGVMGGISAGLGAFAVTKGAAGIAEFLNLGGNFAEGIRDEVDTILSIGDNADAERTKRASASLIEISKGIGIFAGAQGLGALSGISSSILSFFSGSSSPIEQALRLGDNAADVQAGADAFTDFADALGKFSNVNLDFDAEALAEDLYTASKTLELALVGGTEGFIFKQKFVGLNNLTGDMDKAVSSINRLKDSLSLEVQGGPSMQVPNKIEGLMVNTLSVENAILKMPNQNSAGSNTNVVRGGDQIRGGDNYVFNTSSATDSITEGLANR
jgi:hypothetical protein